MLSVLTISIFLYKLYLVRVKLKSRKSASVFNMSHELDFRTKCYIHIGLFHVEGYSHLLLLFSAVDIS